MNMCNLQEKKLDEYVWKWIWWIYVQLMRKKLINIVWRWIRWICAMYEKKVDKYAWKRRIYSRKIKFINTVDKAIF